MKTKKPYWETHANWDTAGNCTLCGEAGRCRCSHPAIKTMKKTAPAHTPTPWIAEEDYTIVDDGGFEIATVEASKHHKSEGEAEANAAFIVRAVNSHEKNQDLLKRVAGMIDSHVNADGEEMDAWAEVLLDLQNAIKAEAEAK